MSACQKRFASTSIIPVFGLLLLVGWHCLQVHGQSSSASTAPSLFVQIVSVGPDAKNHAESFVVLHITVQAGEQKLVIPNCAVKGEREKFFCLARVQPENAEKQLPLWPGDTIGPQDRGSWRPEVIQPHNQETFLWGFNAGFLRVHPGQPLRLRVATWPDVESLGDLKKATILRTPIFAYSEAIGTLSAGPRASTVY
jgi:hypothetical protein